MRRKKSKMGMVLLAIAGVVAGVVFREKLMEAIKKIQSKVKKK